MTVLFDGVVRVDYGQLYVVGGYEFTSNLELSFGGQSNGLCGAGETGSLFLIAGTRNGQVPFRVEEYSEMPAVGESWEDVVEASFSPTFMATLCEWGGTGYDLPGVGAGDYRVRYCASGMDAADNPPETGQAGDSYLLQLWPAPPTPDVIIRQGSQTAAYWHRAVRDLPPPPTAEERAVAALREQVRQRRIEERAQREEAERYDREWWGDRPPSARQRGMRANLLPMVRLDRLLVDAVCEAAAPTQRNVAAWAARRACEQAGLAELDWVAPALDALDAGRTMPAPFGDLGSAFGRLDEDSGGEFTVTVAVDLGDQRPLDELPRISAPHAALPALFAVADPDPAQGAVNALYAAAVTFGDRYTELFAEVRRAFPGLG